MPKVIQHPHMRAAIHEALQGLEEGGIPIGSALARGDTLLAVGHNRRACEIGVM